MWSESDAYASLVFLQAGTGEVEPSTIEDDKGESSDAPTPGEGLSLPFVNAFSPRNDR